MSRSYKKFPLSRMVLRGRSMKWGKTFANRRIRRKLKNPNFEIGNGHYYKFLGLDSWDLYEFKFYQTFQETIHKWESEQKDFSQGIRTWKMHTTLEEDIQEWKKYYVRK